MILVGTWAAHWLMGSTPTFLFSQLWLFSCDNVPGFAIPRSPDFTFYIIELGIMPPSLRALSSSPRDREWLTAEGLLPCSPNIFPTKIYQCGMRCGQLELESSEQDISSAGSFLDGTLRNKTD